MDKEFKQKWINALRSGKYKQGQAVLKRSINGQESFCCLGVAADLQQGPDCWEEASGGFSNYCVVNPKGVICSNACWYNPGCHPDEVEKLIGMNDNGNTFSEIADYIEKNL